MAEPSPADLRIRNGHSRKQRAYRGAGAPMIAQFVLSPADPLGAGFSLG